MSRLNMKIQKQLLKEAKVYLKDVKLKANTDSELQKGSVVLTQGHIEEWLQIFEEDRIKLDGCNMAVVLH